MKSGFYKVKTLFALVENNVMHKRSNWTVAYWCATDHSWRCVNSEHRYPEKNFAEEIGECVMEVDLSIGTFYDKNNQAVETYSIK